MPVTGAALCIVAKLFSNSLWDHVGVIIRHPATGELLFLEADFGGVKLRPLDERVRRSKSNEIAIRRLSIVRTSSMRESFYAFAQEMLGRPYEIGTGSMLARVSDPLAKQERERLNALLLDKRAQVEEITHELESKAHTSFTRRLLQSERARVRDSCQRIHHRLLKELEVSSPADKNISSPSEIEKHPVTISADLSRVFCSELVAATYQRVGLLGSYPPAFYYNPKDFSSEQTHPPGLHLLKSARLSHEVYLRKSSRSSRDAVSSKSRKDFNGVADGDTPSRVSRTFIRDALKRTPVYAVVPDEYKRSHLLKSFRARIVEQGDVVFEQGQFGDCFFIVASGEVERFMQKGDLDPILVSSIGPRSTFGMTGFLYNTPRVSTVRAKQRTLLWELDRPSFELFRDTGSDVKSILSTVDHRTLRGLLKEHFLFQRLDKIGPNDVNSFFLVKFRAGETVFRQGDQGDNFYIVKNGELERHIRHPKPGRRGEMTSSMIDVDEDTLVKTLHDGDSFGELSIMYNAPRSATVRARTDCECWAISTESYHRLNLSGGTQHLRAVFNKNASIKRNGEAYMTRNDLLRFANAQAFPKHDQERLAALLVSLITSNRQRDPIAPKSSEPIRAAATASESPLTSNLGENKDDLLMDFWEFVRFDIVLNQPAAEKAFAFLLADENNSGFISLDEMENLLSAYADIDEEANQLLSNGDSRLRRVFGRDGSRTLAFREFTELSENILPPQFISDVKTLTNHMLNMDVVGTEGFAQQDKEELAYVEPDGNLSMVGSQFMTASSRNKGGGYTDSQIFPSAERAVPRWKSWLDWGHLVSVGISGAVSRTAVAPLERLKILMQTSVAKQYPNGWMDAMRTMIRRDSNIFQAMFRGNGSNVIRIVPSAAIQLLMVDQLREMRVVRNLMSVDFSGRDGSVEQVVSGGVKNRMIEAVLIGGIAGMVATTATYPIDFIRGRLTVQRMGFEPYRGTFHGIRETMRNEGLRTLYRGLGPSLAGVFPCVGLSFAMYETMRPVLPKKNDESGIPTMGSSIFCGMLATGTGQIASFPLDTCRRRMQVAGFDASGSSRATSFMGTWREIGRQMGWRGYFRGILPNLLKVAPASAASFLAYEQVRGIMVAVESTVDNYGGQVNG